MRAHKIECIGDVLNRVLKRMRLQERVGEEGIFSVWNEEVGRHIARHAQPFRIDRGKLVVLVESSAYAQEYSFLKKEIQKKLNKRLGRDIIKKIIFRVGGGHNIWQRKKKEKGKATQ